MNIFEQIGFLFFASGIALGPVVVLIAALRHSAKRQESRHRFLLDLAQRQSLTADMLVEPSAGERDRRRGVVLIAGAVGLLLMLLALPMEYAPGHRLAELWGLACLPALVGGGYLLNWWMARGQSRGND